MAGLRGAGKVYLSVYNNGLYSGYLDMSNIASFTIGNDGGDTVTLKSTAPTNYGAVIGSSTTPGDDTISIALNVPNRKNLTTMLLGTDTAVTNTGAAITNEAVTVLAKGTYVTLVKRKLDTNVAPVVTNVAGSTTYTETTDYVVDYDNGMLYITSASAIVAGTIHVDYTHLDYTGYTIDARTSPSINCKMLFTGENLDSGEIIRMTANSVELSPEGDFSLISADGEFLEFTLSGTIKVPDGATVPFVMEVIS
jgi:hypothetical protein